MLLFGYLRFRYSMNPSGVVLTYWNPDSTSGLASSLVVTALHIHCSSVASSAILARCKYLLVVL